jgi:hypothetical protein
LGTSRKFEREREQVFVEIFIQEINVTGVNGVVLLEVGNGIRLCPRVTNGPSWDQVAQYLFIHLLYLRRSGWQVQRASRQESAGKGQRGGKIRLGSVSRDSHC